MFTRIHIMRAPFYAFRFVSTRRQRTITDKGLIAEREKLLEEAKEMTLSLYRTCIRSVRVIRYGNEHDETNFKKWEEKQFQRRDDGDKRLSMLSMLPPVNREDELRSRADYYLQYTRENFFQESKCLSDEILERQHIQRYIYSLKKGDSHRRWLLRDMKFDDPYQDKFDSKKVDDFEKRALDFCDRLYGKSVEDVVGSQQLGNESHDAQNDDFSFLTDDDEDDSDGDFPDWHASPRRR